MKFSLVQNQSEIDECNPILVESEVDISVCTKLGIIFQFNEVEGLIPPLNISVQ